MGSSRDSAAPGIAITSFGHSCLLAEINGTRVLFDPGNLSHGFAGITGLDAILITHQHPDHVDREALPDLVAANPQAALFADPETATSLNNVRVAGDWTSAPAGITFSVGGITVRTDGGMHAVIHPEIPRVNNTVYLLGDDEHPARLCHPGDAFTIPTTAVDVLALPAAAPWGKISETVDYLRAVAPRVAIPIHQGILSDAGRGIYNGRLSDMAAKGTRFTETVDEVEHHIN